MVEVLEEVSSASVQAEKTASFYDRNTMLHRPYIYEHGLDPMLADDLDTLVTATQAWVRGDHTRPDARTVIHSKKHGYRLKQLHMELGLVARQDLPSGHYDHIIVLGGMHLGNNRRLEFAREQLESGVITADAIVMLGGVRKVYPESEADLIACNIQSLKGAEVEDPLVAEAIKEGPVIIKNESDMLRLAAAIQLGAMSLKHETEKELHFDWNGMPIVVTHTQAVTRNGEPRHTTEACIRDYVAILSPNQGARVGFIATNPHIERVRRSAERILMSNDRPDILLMQGGPEALDSYGYDIFRGEYARNLYEDQKTQELVT